MLYGSEISCEGIKSTEHSIVLPSIPFSALFSLLLYGKILFILHIPITSDLYYIWTDAQKKHVINVPLFPYIQIQMRVISVERENKLQPSVVISTD
jgi:hypothetical protein